MANCLSAQNAKPAALNYPPLYATFRFADQLCSYYPDNIYKQLFRESAFDTPANRELLDKLEGINLYRTMPFEGYPTGQKMPLSLENMIRKNLVVSKDIRDFKSRSAGLLTATELQVLGSILEVYQNIFDQLVYQPNREAIENKIVGLTKLVEHADFDRYLLQGRVFYGSAYDPETPFIMAAIPTLNSAGFKAGAFLNVATTEVPLNFTDYEVMFGIVMHEVYHILFDEISRERKTEIDRWFSEHPSENSRYAYLLLNEVLATALGNGYVYHSLAGKLDPGGWYNQKYINGMAKAAYPLVREYIMEEKPLDKEFVNRYIRLFDTEFPAWAGEPEMLFTYRFVLTDDPVARTYFKQHFPYTSFAIDKTSMTLEDFETLRDTPITKVVVITRQHQERLEMLKKVFPSSRGIFSVKASEEFIRVVRAEDKTVLIVVNVHESEPSRMMAEYFREKSILPRESR